MIIRSFPKSLRARTPSTPRNLLQVTKYPRSFLFSLILSILSIFTVATLLRQSNVTSVGMEMAEARLSSVILEPEFDFFLSACVIVRQSSDTIAEFIVRNFMAGVDHFYVYGDDADDPAEVVRLRKIFSAFHGIVTYINNGRDAPLDEEEPGNYVQMRMYRHCLEEFGSMSKWMTFIDSDEFFETYSLPAIETDPLKDSRRAFIHDILSSHEAFRVLCVRWRSALTNGRMLPPQKGELLHDMFPETCKISQVDNGKLAYKKTILQTKFVNLKETPKLDVAIHKGFSFRGPHLHSNLNCKADLGKHLEPAMHLVHYWSRDLTSYLRKIKRGRPRKTVPARTLKDLFFREEICDPDGVRSSSSIRYEEVKKFLYKVPFIADVKMTLPSVEALLGVGTEKTLEDQKKGEHVQLCQENVEIMLNALSEGREFANAKYCYARNSTACSVLEEGKPLRWPFPWAEYLTNCDAGMKNEEFFL